ncbi:hypothetical protein SAMN04489707_100514 [Paenacidovorax caeni]|uniref:Uncharacterized protein n=1 Tax=Paenacidovorax caeni TaxID=343013 RepID=A0A1I7GC63_9BURK|nr:hypothetical protein SAMN04489707_100514 [Paenacidovorax caeni]
MCALLLSMIKLAHDILSLSRKRIGLSKCVPHPAHSWAKVWELGFVYGAADMSADTLTNPVADAIQHARCKVSRSEWNGQGGRSIRIW